MIWPGTISIALCASLVTSSRSPRNDKAGKSGKTGKTISDPDDNLPFLPFVESPVADPINASDIESVIKSGLYIDKTQYAQEILQNCSSIFIARPPGFGKSLFVSTLEAICDNKKELFKDYYIGNPDNGYPWKKFPVIKIDFAQLDHDDFEESLNEKLMEIARSFNLTLEVTLLETGIDDLFDKISEMDNDEYNRNSIVLVDNFDSPIVSKMHDKETKENNMKLMRIFFTVLGDQMSRCQLLFATGVCGFFRTHVLTEDDIKYEVIRDVTLDGWLNEAFGFTWPEIERTFSKKLEEISETWTKEMNEKITVTKLQKEIAKTYGGYRFTTDLPVKGEKVFNPTSFLAFLQSGGKLYNYWYKPNHTDFLMRQVLETNDPERFDTISLKKPDVLANITDLLRTGDMDVISLQSLFFQTGHLTVTGFESGLSKYERGFELWILNYPNREIKESYKRIYGWRNSKKKLKKMKECQD